MPDADFTIVDSPELVAALAKLARRYQRAVQASQRSNQRAGQRSSLINP